MRMEAAARAILSIADLERDPMPLQGYLATLLIKPPAPVLA